MSAKKPKTISEEAAAVLAAWRRIDQMRTRLKGDALAARVGAKRPRTSVMELRLLDIDDVLASAARLTRGWRDLAKLQREARRHAPKRDRAVVEDLAAVVADEARLADEPWYVGGEKREDAVERLLAPWRDIHRARAVFLARVRRHERAALARLARFDAKIVALADTMRIKKHVDDVLARHSKAHVLHGKLLAVRHLVEEMRRAEEAAIDIAAGRSRKDVPVLYAMLVAEAARKHGGQGATFTRVRYRAFFRAYADAVDSCACGVRRSVADVQAALVADDVQALVGTNIKQATLRVMDRLRIGKARTIEARIAQSDASHTSP